MGIAGVTGCPLPQGDLGVYTDTQIPGEGSSDASTDEPQSSTGEPASTGEPTSTGGTSETDEPDAVSSCMQTCDETWVYDGPVDFLNPELDPSQFECVGRITGVLLLSGTIDPATLGVFRSLRQVDGGVVVYGNPLVTDLSFLGCLESTPELNLNQLANLTQAGPLTELRDAPRLVISGTGLTALPSFAPDYAGFEVLYLDHNPELVDLDGAAAWPALGELELVITDNPKLANIDVLAQWLTAFPHDATISLFRLPALPSLDALAPLRSGGLGLQELPLVDSLAPLANLENSPSLGLRGLPLVNSLAGLSNLEHVERFWLGLKCYPDIVGMTGLTSLAGLDSLKTVQEFVIGNNPGLETLAGAPALTNIHRLDVVGTPLISQEEVDGFLATIDSSHVCLGESLDCDCF